VLEIGRKRCSKTNAKGRKGGMEVGKIGGNGL
jgi:hypothetical protein